MNKNFPLCIVQISDCHLFASKSQLHYGANVYHHLCLVLENIASRTDVDCIVFTGDLSQDHTEGSYHLFVQAFSSYNIDTPVYYLAGNHDDPALLSQFLVQHPFDSSKVIEQDLWQIMLLDSKSATPAGEISKQSFSELKNEINPDKHQLLMMHHHPVNVGYFIDRHGLINKESFWQNLESFESVKGIACGHVHRAMELLPVDTGHSIPVYTCPATSIEFDTELDGVSSTGKGPSYRYFRLFENGDIETSVCYIEK